MCLLPTDWNFWERGFAAITWCPKATVQAALSTVALDYVEDNISLWTGQEEIDQLRRARQLFVVAVLSIILTAPLFAVIMSWAGRTWLQKEDVAHPGGVDNLEVIDEQLADDDAADNGISLWPKQRTNSRQFVMRIDMDYEDTSDWLDNPLALRPSDLGIMRTGSVSRRGSSAQQGLEVSTAENSATVV